MPSLKRTINQIFYDNVYYRNIINDPLFDLRKVDEGIASRIGRGDTQCLPRIIESYNRAKSLQAEMPLEYQVGNEWLPIFSKYLSEVIRALTDRDVAKLDEIYSNFMRNDCSVGLHGFSFSMKRDFFSGKIKRHYKKIYMRDTLHRMHLWKQYCGSTYTFADLVSPDIGNPYGIVLEDQFIRTGSFYNHYYATQLGKLMRGRGDSRKVVLEVGAGYGAMAYYLCRDNENLTYITLDLPENMALTAYYLMTAFPDKKILLHGEKQIDRNTLEQYDIVFLANTDIETLPSESCDVVFNSYSLAEMSRETIDLYIKNVMRLCRGYFLHINHNKMAEVIADDFGMDEMKYNMLYQIPALWNYGRNVHMDEYEYLYQRISNE